MTFNQFALKPDIIFFIDVDDKVCYERMAIRNMPPELFETKLAESRRKFLKGIQFLKENGTKTSLKLMAMERLKPWRVKYCQKYMLLHPIYAYNNKLYSSVKQYNLIVDKELTIIVHYPL